MKPLLHIPAAELSALGIVAWGYTSKTRPISYESFTRWLPANGELLPFLATPRNIAFRADLQAWWPEAKAALVFLFSYAPTKKSLLEQGLHRVAGYSLGFDGDDYHPIMKSRLHEIGKKLQEKIPLQFKHSHDAEPVLERDLAFRAGLGWFGKNSLMINRQHGSYFLIGSLVIDRTLPIVEEQSVADHCGTCRACVEACPTHAIDPETRTIQAKACIATWTIEDHSGETPAPLGLEQARGEVFGCDICQDVCPWNQRALQSVVAQLGPKAQRWLNWFSRPYASIHSEVSAMTGRAFLRFTMGSPFGRPRRASFLRTLFFWIRRNEKLKQED